VVTYAPTKDSVINSKDEFYVTLKPVVNPGHPRNQIVVLVDFNVVSGVDCIRFELGICNFGTECWKDNSLYLLTMCSVANRTILGSWFRQRDIVTPGCRMIATYGKRLTIF